MLHHWHRLDTYYNSELQTGQSDKNENKDQRERLSLFSLSGLLCAEAEKRRPGSSLSKKTLTRSLRSPRRRHQTTCEDWGGGEATVYNHGRRASSKQCATVDIKILYFVFSGLIVLTTIRTAMRGLRRLLGLVLPGWQGKLHEMARALNKPDSNKNKLFVEAQGLTRQIREGENQNAIAALHALQ